MQRNSRILAAMPSVESELSYIVCEEEAYRNAQVKAEQAELERYEAWFFMAAQRDAESAYDRICNWIAYYVDWLNKTNCKYFAEAVVDLLSTASDWSKDAYGIRLYPRLKLSESAEKLINEIYQTW